MGTITIDQAIKGIMGLGNRVANRAVVIMKEEAATKDGHTPTGHKEDKPLGEGSLVGSIRILEGGFFSHRYVIGSDLYYAKFVDQGRGPVTPKNKKWLHWIDTQHGPVFKDNPLKSGQVFTKYAKATTGNHFVKRTKTRLEGEKFSIVE